MSRSLSSLLCTLVLLTGCPAEPEPAGGTGGGEGAGGDDTGAGCDDTAAPAACEIELPTPTVPAPAACPSGATTFDPVVQWAWEDCGMGVIVTPAVGDLDGDGISDVAFTAFLPQGVYDHMPGELVVVSGDGSVTELLRIDSLTDPATGTVHTPSGRGNVALGDLDADGTPEVCVVTMDASVACLNVDGSPTGLVKFVVPAEGTLSDPILASMGPPAVADMDGDGLGELVWGRQAFTETGTLQFASPGGYGSPGGAQGRVYAGTIGQADADAPLELLTSTTPYDHLGGENWYYPWDGMAASADLDLDGTSEVVATYTWWNGGSGSDWFPAMRVALSDATETHVELVDGDWSGAPTIANFDTDPELEIAVSSETLLRVYDADLTLLWSFDIADSSSGFLSATAVDWDGDGVWELLHADEEQLRLFDVDDGLELFAGTGVDTTQHASGTHLEAPSVADLDGDGSLEIIVPSNVNVAGDPGWSGVRVIGSASGTWAGTARVWNQHAYVASHVDDDLSLVTTPPLASEGFRAAKSVPPQPTADLADLAIIDAERCEDCPTGTYGWVSVANLGLADAGNFVVSAYDSSGALVYQESVLALDSGDATWIGPLVSAQADTITWVVDDFGMIEECDETDNTFDFEYGACP